MSIQTKRAIFFIRARSDGPNSSLALPSLRPSVQKLYKIRFRRILMNRCRSKLGHSFYIWMPADLERRRTKTKGKPVKLFAEFHFRNECINSQGHNAKKRILERTWGYVLQNWRPPDEAVLRAPAVLRGGGPEGRGDSSFLTAGILPRPRPA